MVDSELSKRPNELELKPEQRFEQLNLKELGFEYYCTFEKMKPEFHRF